MTTMNEEARTKLKAIMSAKLIEMVGHCESELPDYVVSMISNNKSKDYMRANLVLFIGDHAEAFSEWLSELKDKIYQERSSKTEVTAPVASGSSDEVKPEQKKVMKKATTDTSADDNEKATRKRKRIEYDIKDENRKSRSDRRDKHDDRKRSHSRDRIRKTSRKESPQRRRRERSKTWSDDEFGDPIPAGKKTAAPTNNLPHEPHPKSKVVSSVTVLTPEPSSPKSKVASTVTVPAADPAFKAKRLMLNNSDKAAKTRSNIFFKAMSEASRAGNGVPKVNKNNVRVDVGDNDLDDDESIVRAGLARTGGPSVKVRLDLPSPPGTTDSKPSGDAAHKIPLKRKIVWDIDDSGTSSAKKEKQSASGSSRSNSRAITSPKTKSAKPHYIDDQENEAAIDAFIAATNLEMLMRGKSDNEDEEIHMSDDDEPSSKFSKTIAPDIPLSVSANVEDAAKPKKRCVFWPACMKGQECEFIHPSVVCSKFPRCAFGQQCLYIHPPCKFGSLCRNTNCAALHGTPESLQEVYKLLGITAPVVSSKNMHLKRNEPTVIMDVVQKSFSDIPCRFRNMCKNPSCIYKHPVECRFGRDCQMNACPFRHSEGKKPVSTFPEASKYKWKATA